MTIEVKQLLIKSTVQDNGGAERVPAEPGVDTAALKDELLAECRRMLTEMLRERRER